MTTDSDQIRSPVPRRELSLAREAVPFQSDASAIEHAPIPGFALATVWLLLLAITTAIGWACFAQLDRVVAARGRLVTTVPNFVVQPLETSIIRRIYVEPGRTVRKGDVLAELDPTFATADLEQLRKRRNVLKAQIARLSAELFDVPFDSAAGSGPEHLMQRALFEQRRRERELKLNGFDQQLAELDAALGGTRTSAELLEDQLGLASEVEQMRVKLAQNHTTPRTALLEARQKRLELEVAQRSAQDRLVGLGHRAQALRAQREAYLEEWRRIAAEQLIATQLEYGEVVEQLEKASRRIHLVVLRAPEDAVVLEIADRSVDSVVQEAEALFTLVPLGKPLEAEIEIDAEDIGYVAAGNEVRVKLDAFPFQRHGLLEGRLRTLSEDAFLRRPSDGALGEGPATYYRSRVRLTTTHLRNVPEATRLLPGMTVRTEIRVGRRRVITYFLYPLIRALDESLREPV